MARPHGPHLMWTSAVLNTRESTDAELRGRHGQKVEVLGTTTDRTGLLVRISLDVRVICDGALITVPPFQIRRLREERV
jgi:hypothetical protein